MTSISDSTFVDDDSCVNLHYDYTVSGLYIGAVVLLSILMVLIILAVALQALLPRLKCWTGPNPSKEELLGIHGHLKGVKTIVVGVAVFIGEVWYGVCLIFVAGAKFTEGIAVCGYAPGDYSCADPTLLFTWKGVFNFNFVVFCLIYAGLALRELAMSLMWSGKYLDPITGIEKPDILPSSLSEVIPFSEMLKLPDPEKEGCTGFRLRVLQGLLYILSLVFSPMVAPMLAIPLNGDCFHDENIVMIIGMAIIHLVMLILVFVVPFAMAFAGCKKGECLASYVGGLMLTSGVYIVGGALMGLILVAANISSDLEGIAFRWSFTVCLPMILKATGSATTLCFFLMGAYPVVAVGGQETDVSPPQQQQGFNQQQGYPPTPPGQQPAPYGFPEQQQQLGYPQQQQQLGYPQQEQLGYPQQDPFGRQEPAGDQ